MRSSETLRWKSLHNKYFVLINTGDYFSPWCILKGNTKLWLRVRAGLYHILCPITCRAQSVMHYPVIKVYLRQDWKLWDHSLCNYTCFQLAVIIILTCLQQFRLLAAANVWCYNSKWQCDMERRNNADFGHKVVWKKEILLGFDCMALYSIPHTQQMELVDTLITNT